MTTISPAKYVRVNHVSPSNNIWFYKMTDGKWTIQYGSQSNTAMASKIVDNPARDLMLIPYTFLPQFDGIEFDIVEFGELMRSGCTYRMDDIDEPGELGVVLLRSGMTRTRRLDFTGLSKRQVIDRIVQFYAHKTYRKVFETHGTRFYGFMINVIKGEPPIIMLDR